MILNVYKPKGWTSFDVVAKLKGTLKIKKIGHAGTLDPLAEGILIVLTDVDTKKQDEFMKLAKEYVAEIAFGIESPTYDLEMIPNFTDKIFSLENFENQLKGVLPAMIGFIDQTAPAYSAKKVNGRALYKRVRAGQDVSKILPVKTVQIESIIVNKIFEKDFETDVGLKKLPTLTCTIRCSSGTYIRSIAYDLGEKLKCGAVMTALKRTKIGDFNVEDSKDIKMLAIPVQ